MPGLRISDRDCRPVLKSWKYGLTKSSSKSFAFKRSTSINVRSTDRIKERRSKGKEDKE